MIILDFSQVIISNLMTEIGTKSREDVSIDINLLRHVVINTIRSLKVKFEREYGELVIACDSKNYWRKKVFPYYKANRKKAREESGLDWSAIFDCITTIKDELKVFFPYKVLDVETAEADDIIATLVEWNQLNNIIAKGLIEEPAPVLIISGDHDFIQLQKYKNVKQYSPVQKKFIKPDTSPEEYVLEHIIKGDRGDGIPNVLSDDECIIKGERQKSVSQKKLQEWIKTPESMPKDVGFLRNLHRNRALIDLSYIPGDLRYNIINTFTEAPSKDKSQLLNYFIQNRMKLMMEHIGEF